MKNKFDFFEVVKVVSKDNQNCKHNAKTGVIIGMAEDEENNWSYALTFSSGGSFDADLDEHELESTGRFMKREDFYDGSSVTVTVNEQGEGRIKSVDLRDQD